jgi:WS/DGAT/MGAT family acyltransferase
MADRLTALDAMFLYMERPNVQMHVASVAVLDPSALPGGRLRFEDLKALVAARIRDVPRFRQKVVFLPLNVGRPMWVDDDHFDLDFHMRRAALPEPGGHAELADYVQRVHSRALDRTRSLWEMYLIEGLEDGRVAVYTKTHHAMIDGLSGIDIASVLYDLTPDEPAGEPEPWTPEPAPSTAELMRRWAVDSVTHPVEAAAVQASAAMHAPRAALGATRTALASLGTFVGSGRAPASPFNVEVSQSRRFSFGDVVLDDAKAIKNAFGTTVNDVILAVTAGALGRLLEARGDDVGDLSLRAMVPVSTRDESQRMAFGNRVSMFFVDLPVGPMDPIERLRLIATQTHDLKEKRQAIGAASIVGMTRWAPPTLHALAARLTSKQRFINLVVSNVPGPNVPLYLAGARLIGMYPLMPLIDRTALSIAITSLSGVMGFGFTGDWDALPDIDALPAHLTAAVADLKKAAGV